jgi:anti-sigma factor RsiW
MGRWWKTNACDRAAQWVSLDLDGELSQFEQAALARHCERCARCRALGQDVASFTRLLREAPLVELERPIVVAGTRTARIRVARRAALSFAVVGATAAAVLGLLLPTPGGASTSALSFESLQQQKRFAHVETSRIDPIEFVAPTPLVPSLTPRVLV